MKNTLLLLIAFSALISCTKSGTTTTPPTPPVDNGPLGGTYTLTALTSKSYDTTAGSGILTMYEYITTTTNLTGSITITGSNISSKGQMHSYSTSGTRKEMNTASGAVITTNLSPLTGSSGSASGAFNSNYTIDATALELTIDNAQYLFNPAFISQPANKKHSYTVTGNTLKVTTNAYTSSSRSRAINEATFTKQ
jgi:hypothetical protein